MGKPKAPKPPDPIKTAAGQTSSNVGTAIANAELNQYDQITPDGSLQYRRIGQGDLSNEDQALIDQVRWNSVNAKSEDLRKAARDRLPRLYDRLGSQGAQDYMWKDPTTGQTYFIPQYEAIQTLSDQQQAIKDASDSAELNMSQLARDQSGKLQSLLGSPFDLSGLPQRGDLSGIRAPNYRDAQTRFASGGAIATGFGNAGPIQRQVANAGDITRSYGTDFSEDRQRVEEALMSRLSPQIERDRDALRTRLANTGLTPGSEAYNREMERLERNVADQRTSVLLAGGQEQSRLADLEARRAGFENAAQAQQFQQNLAGGQFANQAQAQRLAELMGRAQFSNQAVGQRDARIMSQADARNRAIAQNNQTAGQRFQNQLQRYDAQNAARDNALTEAFAARNQPINEITALLSGSQVSMPSFVSTPQSQIANTDYAGIVNQAFQNEMDIYKQKSQQSQALMGGLFDLAGSLGGAAMMSDRRVKEDIERVGEVQGLPLYRYRYKGDPKVHVGLMAQDVEKVRPDAVVEIGGIKHVDYTKALEAV